MTKLKDISGNSVVDAGVYSVKLKAVTMVNGPSGPYLKPVYSILGGTFHGKTVDEYVSLTPQSVWKLKLFLIAFGASEEDDWPIQENPHKEPKYLIDEHEIFARVKGELLGNTASIEIGVEKPNEEGKAKGWTDKNRVLKYEPSELNTSKPSTAAKGEPEWD